MLAPHDPVLAMTTAEIDRLPGITAVAPTLYALLGVSSSAGTIDSPLPQVLDAATAMGGPAERCLVVAADAIGLAHVRHYPDVLVPVETLAPCAVILRAMEPSVTPVCYGSMFSGVTPEVHGIRAYEKPVLTVETLFDVLPRANKRVAIVAAPDCSIDRIFRGRPVDYYNAPDDDRVVECALRLLQEDRYDVLVVYQGDYDSALHRSTPWTDEAIAVMRRTIANFTRLAAAFDASPWQRYRRVIHFAPDHGAHTGENGKGTHGSILPEDMVVQHYFGFRSVNPGSDTMLP